MLHWYFTRFCLLCRRKWYFPLSEQKMQYCSKYKLTSTCSSEIRGHNTRKPDRWRERRESIYGMYKTPRLFDRQDLGMIRQSPLPHSKIRMLTFLMVTAIRASLPYKCCQSQTEILGSIVFTYVKITQNVLYRIQISVFV